MKTKTIKMIEYANKYSEIPKDYRERLEWMYNKYGISDKIANDIVNNRINYINSTYYNNLIIVLYEIPEATPRPRARIVTRNEIYNSINGSNSYIQIYSAAGKRLNDYVKKYTQANLQELEQLLCTPTEITFNTYFPTPNSYNKIDKFMAEIGCIRPIIKPDFDNIEKAYSDAFTGNIWIDDVVVTDAHFHKYYSILPRVEIIMNYMNHVGSYQQYRQIINRKDFTPEMNLSYFGQ